MLQKRGRSDKAETYRDRFDMVVKIEECLFVSRCHQRVEGTLNEHELYLQKAFLVVTRRGLNSECRYYQDISKRAIVGP